MMLRGYAVTCAKWGAGSFAAFLGALYCSKALRELWMGMLWLRLQSKVDKMLREEKLKFLSNAKLQGVVLDVGSGGGIQLQHIAAQPLVTKVICVEPNPHFRRALAAAAERAMEQRRGVTGALPLEVEVVEATIEQYLARLNGTPGGAESRRVDVVTCLLVLCSVPAPEAIVRQLHDGCLKPGGRLLFVEHVRPEPEGGLLHVCFRCVQPAWTLLGDGCQLCRPTQDTVKGCAPWAASESYLHYPPKAGPVQLPWAFGIATKASK